MLTYASEFIGTFILVLAILVAKNEPTKPLYIGLALVVAIILVSGLGGMAHLNPVVTIVQMQRGQCPTETASCLMLMQLLGAAAATVLVPSCTEGR